MLRQLHFQERCPFHQFDDDGDLPAVAHAGIPHDALDRCVEIFVFVIVGIAGGSRFEGNVPPKGLTHGKALMPERSPPAFGVAC
ncbi:MAG TPA: hypothetical protein VN697_04605 [Tepidiformaceae bacterium]|nr:hypothetical protein [Tepidiformaceae bacterium]